MMLTQITIVVMITVIGTVLGLVIARSYHPRTTGIPSYPYPPPPPPPDAEWRPVKAHELVKGRVYRDPLAKVMVRVTKPAIAGSCSALENTARGMYWNTVTQCYQAMDIRDDQLEERIPAPPEPPK